VKYTVRVKPGSRKGPHVEASADGLTVHVRERAVDGAANEGLVTALATHFGVARSRVEIVRGHASRVKHVEVDL